VIANGGLLVRPKIVLKRGDKAEPTETPVRILKPETVMTMRMMMEGVVLRGTARLTARLDGYTSAGKTGTAQIFEHGHYTHLYNASFMGFAPVTNPQLVIVVTLNGTEGNAGMGGAAAAPVFKAIATEAMRMFDVPKDIPEDFTAKKQPVKDGKPPVEDVSIADLGGESIMAQDESVRELIAAQAKLAVKDDDEIPPAPAAPPNTPGAPISAAPLAFAPPASPVAPPAPPKPKWPTVPDFRGKSMRDVVEEASADGIEVLVEGSGVARAQLPQAGEPLRRGERIRVVFTR
jgi:membrane peptidoglycan carboxypeptidase